MTKEKIRKIIWGAIAAHFALIDPVRLEANLKYERNKTIAQVIAVGLCDQYDIPRETTESLMCIDPVSYDHKLRMFRLHVKRGMEDSVNRDGKEWMTKYELSSRYVRRRIRDGYFVFK